MCTLHAKGSSYVSLVSMIRSKAIKRGKLWGCEVVVVYGRECLSAPVGGVLFFAGEATHPAVNPCMQAALETGERAAAQVIRASEQISSKL